MRSIHSGMSEESKKVYLETKKKVRSAVSLAKYKIERKPSGDIMHLKIVSEGWK